MLSLGKRLPKMLLALTVLLQIGFMPFPGLPESQVAAAADRTFKIAVLPDTQMYSRYKPEIYDSQTDWIKKYQYSENIVFTTHLGDIVDQSTKEIEWKNADRSMKILDNAGAPYGYTTGNHDIADWLNDDSRDDSDIYNRFFNQYFKPSTRMMNAPGYEGSSPKGYSSYYTFKGAGKTFLALFIDWRAGPDTIKWANQVLKDHPNYPTILSTHQLLNIDSDGKTAVMTDNGQYLWDELIKGNDQIFLTLNGHHHGTANMTKKNDKGHDVFMSVIDYQGYYMGGNGIMRTMEFNLDAGTISAKTFSPWVMNMPEDARDETYDLEEITDANNQFTVNMNFKERFKGIWDNQNSAPQAADLSYSTAEGKTLSAKLKATDTDADKLAYSIVTPATKGTVRLVDAATGAFLYTPASGVTGTDTFTFKANDGFVDSDTKTVTITIRSVSEGNGELAHWKFEKPADGSFNVKDLTGNGNDLYRVDVIKNDIPDIDMKWSDEKSPYSKSQGSLKIDSHGKIPDELSYLRTKDDAPLNAMTFQEGYTIEAYFRIASNFDGVQNAWMGILGRGGTGADGGKTDGDKEEPLATLSISNLKQLQWAAYPSNSPSLKTNWSGEMFFDWIHVAVVNDTKTTKMYVNGSPVLTNDDGPNSIGVSTGMRNGKFVPWIVGAYHYDNVFEKGFNGNINEIRITDHALDYSEFLINENEIPVSNDSAVTTDQNKAYSGKLSAADPDNNPLSYEIVAAPTNGIVSVDKQTGNYVYTPNRDYNGPDLFTFRTFDGKVYSNEARVSVTVNKNSTPKALDGTYIIVPGNVLSGMMNAEDADGDKLTFEVLKKPGKGSNEVTDASTGAFKFTPANGQSGLDYFTFRVSDGKNESAEAAVIVEIRENMPNTGDWAASNLEYSVRQGGTLTGTLSDAVEKSDHDKVLQVKVLRQPEKGQVTVTEASYGSFVYKPDSGKSGTDVFTFQIGDEKRTTNEAYVVIHIEPNGKPVTVNLQIQTLMNTRVDGQLKGSDTENDSLMYSIVDQPKSGVVTVTDAAYGLFNYAPNSGFSGTDKFTYKVNDGLADSNISEVSVTVSQGSNGGGNGGSGGGTPIVTPTPTSTPKPGPTPTPTPVVEQKPSPNPATPVPTEKPAPPAPFVDLSAHWAKEAVSKLNALNAISGYPDGSFKPEREMTRAEFVSVLVKALQLKGDEGTAFTDMNGHWAEAVVRTATSLGIINGTGGTSFNPDLKITREQMAVILVRAMNLKDDSAKKSAFVDQNDVSAWAASSLNMLANQNIIKGYEDGTFRPKKAMTRAEAASVLVKVIEIQAGK